MILVCLLLLLLFKMPVCFLIRVRKGMDLVGWGGEKGCGRGWGRVNSNQNVVYEKNSILNLKMPR